MTAPLPTLSDYTLRQIAALGDGWHDRIELPPDVYDRRCIRALRDRGLVETNLWYLRITDEGRAVVER